VQTLRDRPACSKENVKSNAVRKAACIGKGKGGCMESANRRPPTLIPRLRSPNPARKGENRGGVPPQETPEPKPSNKETRCRSPPGGRATEEGTLLKEKKITNTRAFTAAMNETSESINRYKKG